MFLTIMSFAVAFMLSCRKEEGYTGFVDPSEIESTEMSLTTDKAVYMPGEEVIFTAKNPSTGTMTVRYCHMGHVVDSHSLTSDTWSWTVPADDYKGYMVEVCLTSAQGDQVLATIGVDVSSDWNRFPRYGFLSYFPDMSEVECEQVIAKLNRLHINGVQFQDWHYKHHWPLGGTADAPMETYLDIANRHTSLNTLKNYIASIHSHGMKAIFYNLCFGALDDAEDDGVKKEWFLFNDSGHQDHNIHELSAPFKSSIYLVDPGNAEWQEYIGRRNDDIYSVLDFDGYQIDQLGDRGTLYRYDGSPVQLDKAYPSFINAMKMRHPDKDLIMNSVTSYGAEEIVGTGNVAFAYNEVWENDYSDLRDIIENNYSYSQSENLPTVFAAYMNYNKASSYGVFNTPGVLLTDAVMFALGGSHLELGEHMLGMEYFPNNNLSMSSELETSIVRYYDFLTAYQNLLRDGGKFNDIPVSVASEELYIKGWAPECGFITTICREMEGFQVIHLINFTDADSVSWKDADGTMPEPDLIGEFEVTVNAESGVKNVWMASPDISFGAHMNLDFAESEDGGIKVRIPSLKYWNMIVLEY